MLTTTEIAAGSLRLIANKLTASDQEDLVIAFRLYLRNRFADFSDAPARLAALTDNNQTKTAAKLAAVLTLLQESGFDLAELGGARTAIQSNEAGELIRKIEHGLALLGYTVPGNFSGSINAGDENAGGSGGGFYGSVSVPVNVGW